MIRKIAKLSSQEQQKIEVYLDLTANTIDSLVICFLIPMSEIDVSSLESTIFLEDYPENGNPYFDPSQNLGVP